MIILTGIDNDIYSIVDACPNACEMWKAIERLKQGESINVLDLETNLLLGIWKIHITGCECSVLTLTTTRMAKDKEIDKLIALISLSFKKIYKPTNNNLQTSSNTSRANQDKSLRVSRGTGYDNQRIVNVARARETVGTTVVQKSRIQCCNCKEYGHVARECQKPKRAKDAAYHKKKMLLSHYMYMVQIQEVNPDAADNSGPIFDSEPLKKVPNNDNYNVFAIKSKHPEQSKSVNDTYPIEQDEHNMIIDSLDMSYDREHVDQDDDDDDDLANERDLLASLIEKLKCEIDDSKNRNKFLETSNKVLVDKLQGQIEDFKTKNKSLGSSNNHFKEANNELSKINQLMYKDLKKFQAELNKYHDVKYASKVEIDCAKAKGDLMSYKMEFEKSFNEYTQAQIQFYKTHEDKEIDKVIALENKVKVLDNIVYKTGQSVQTMNMLNRNCKMSFAKPEFLKKAQRANPRLVNSRTKMPMAVPISTREPKCIVNQSVAKPLWRIDASESTNQKPRHTTRKLYEHVTKTCSWYPKFTLPGYKWKPKSQIGNVNPKVSMPLGNASRTANILEPMTPRNSHYKRIYYVEGLNHNLFSIGQFYDADLEVAFRKSTCYIRDLKGNDLLTRSHGTDLYYITLQDTSSPNPICLMAKATSSQAWLWHRRLSHMNFDTINLLSKNDIVIGLPKLKFVEDHLCSSCELGKAKRKSFQKKTTPSFKRRLHLLHIDLCGPIRVESINGRKYVLVIVDDYYRYTWTHFLRSKDETPEVLIDFLRIVQRGLHAQVRIVRTDKGTEFLNKTLHTYFASEGIQHQMSVGRTPEQNGVVERRNRILVEAARTMLSATKVPLFFWAEAIATACFTQNRSLEKGDARIFVGYSTQSRAYMVFNKRTRVIVETIHVNFDELPQMASDHVSSDPVPQCQRAALEHDNLSLGPQSQENIPQAAGIVTTSNELDLLFSPMFDELLIGSTQVVSKSSAVTTADAPNQCQQQHTTPLNTQTTPEPTCQVPTQAPTVTSTENINQAKTITENAQVKDDEFINIFCTSFQDRGETSSRHVDSSNMHKFYQRHPSEYRWTKDHPLEQVIGNPSQLVRTRSQLESDGEMCMFALTVSQTEPKNIQEAMADSAWIESM
nr:hypothetical protein [Tanacetum cinerariifolium]